MKTNLAIVVGLALAGFAYYANAQVVFPFADGFNYPEGENLGTANSSGVIWNVGNSPGGGSPVITNSAALTYPMLQPLGGRGVLSSGVPASNRDRGVSIGNPAGALVNWSDLGVLYVSYLLRVDAGPSGNPRLISAYRDSSGTSGGFTPSGGLWINPSLQVGIGKQSSATNWTTDALSVNATNLIVLKYQYVEGSDNDIMSLWINPPASSFGGTEPTPTLSTSSGSDDTGISIICLTLRTSASLNGGGTYAIDEFRLGKTWADVTPVIPEPAAVALSMLGGFGLLLLRLRRK